MLDEILAEARKLCEPDEEERRRVAKVADNVLQRALEVITMRGVEVAAVLGGSYAKDTWLKGDCDIDLFLKFPTKLSLDDFRRVAMDVAEEVLAGYPTSVRYSEHPYLEGFINGVRVNVVPCYDVRPKQWVSAADRSPYHTEYVKKHLEEELKSEVRLLKKFLKARGVYGAEVKTKGFSGYVCEVLILKHRSFINTLRFFSDLSRGAVVSLTEIPADVRIRFQSPIVILDPVDPERNLGAAVSEKSLATFISAARSFLKKPRLDYFVKREADLKDQAKLEMMLDNLVLLLFRHERRSPDILWGQLHKTAEAIEKHLKIRGFEVLNACEASSEDDESAILLLLESPTLPRYMVKIGPEVYRREDSIRFVEKNLKRSAAMWFAKDGRLISLQERADRDVAGVLRSILSNPAGIGVAEGLRDALKTSAKIFIGKDILEALRTVEWLKREVQRFVSTDQLTFDSN